MPDELFLTLEMEVETLREPVKLDTTRWEESREKKQQELDQLKFLTRFSKKT